MAETTGTRPLSWYAEQAPDKLEGEDEGQLEDEKEKRIANLDQSLEIQADKIDKLLSAYADLEEKAEKLTAENERLLDRAERAEHLHGELIMQISKKYPGETRHETALRFIKIAENRPWGVAKEAQDEPK